MDDPRVLVQMRVRQSSLTKIDSIAQQLDWTRSAVLRTLLALGLRAWDRGER